MSDGGNIPSGLRAFESVEDERVHLGPGDRVHHHFVIVARDSQLSAVESSRRSRQSVYRSSIHVDAQQVVILKIRIVSLGFLRDECTDAV